MVFYETVKFVNLNYLVFSVYTVEPTGIEVQEARPKVFEMVCVNKCRACFLRTWLTHRAPRCTIRTISRNTKVDTKVYLLYLKFSSYTVFILFGISKSQIQNIRSRYHNKVKDNKHISTYCHKIKTIQ